MLTSKWGLRLWITIGNNAEMENWKQLRLCPLALCSEILQTNLGLLHTCCNTKRHHWNIYWVFQCLFLLVFLYQVGSVLWSVSTCQTRVVHAQWAFMHLCRVRHTGTLSNSVQKQTFTTVNLLCPFSEFMCQQFSKCCCI